MGQAKKLRTLVWRNEQLKHAEKEFIKRLFEKDKEKKPELQENVENGTEPTEGK